LQKPEKNLRFRWIIEENWKLIAAQPDEKTGIELYYLLDDPNETQNLAETQPQRVKTLLTKLDAFYNPRLTVQNHQIHFERFENNPMITASLLPGSDGNDINGHSLIKTPDWLPEKWGTYYLYFTRHAGQSIRPAYADDLKCP
jgi:hypothetical protein